ncbi:MAG: AAA family ATPase [Rhizomicrobium sp.]
MIRDNFYILTGGPGAGKTTLLEALRARGYDGVGEVGRAIIQEQKAAGGDIHHNGDRAAYRDLMLQRSLEGYLAVAETVRPVFFDRGIPELAGYSHFVGDAPPAYVLQAIEACRYNPLVFAAPPWREIYVNDAERKQDFAEAILSYDLCRQAYEAFGYRVVDLPPEPVEERVRFVLDRIGV